MKQKIHAMATALAFFKQNAKSLRQKSIGSLKQKAEDERLKAIRKSSQKQSTQRPFATPFDSAQEDKAQGDVVEEEAVVLRQDAKIVRHKAIRWMGKVVGQFWQKQLTNRLSLRPGAQASAPLITMTGKRRGRAVKIRPNLIISLVLLAVVVIIGKQTKAQTKALQIGDTIPEAVWNSPLKTINYPESKSIIKLGDHKAKLLILDFWATWCSPCVAAFPKMDSLRQAFGQNLLILPVSGQTEQAIIPFFKGMEKAKGIRGFSVYGDTLLRNVFRYAEIPHYVWIRDGRLLAVTHGDEVRQGNIQKILAGEHPDMAFKQETGRRFDTGQPLLMGANAQAEENVLGYKVFTRYVEGYPSMVSSKPVGKSGWMVLALNSSPYRLFQLAYSEFKPELLGNNSRTIIEAKDSLLLKGQSKKEIGRPAMMDWFRQSTYCYQLIRKDHSAQIWADMQQDLYSYFPQLRAGIEKRPRPCLLLVKTKTYQSIAAMGGATEHRDDKFSLLLKNADWTYFTGRLKNYYLQNQAPLIDETGISGKVNLQLVANLSDLTQLNAALAKYGLAIIAGERPLDCIVIKDR